MGRTSPVDDPTGPPVVARQGWEDGHQVLVSGVFKLSDRQVAGLSVGLVADLRHQFGGELGRVDQLRPAILCRRERRFNRAEGEVSSHARREVQHDAEARAGAPLSGSRTWMCTIAAPALAASIDDAAISAGVTGTLWDF